MYNPAEIRWDVLNDIMSLYYLHIYRIFGLNGVVHMHTKTGEHRSKQVQGMNDNGEKTIMWIGGDQASLLMGYRRFHVAWVWGSWEKVQRCCEIGGRESDQSEFQSKFSPQPVTISTSFLCSGYSIMISPTQTLCSIFGVYYPTLNKVLFCFSSTSYPQDTHLHNLWLLCIQGLWRQAMPAKFGECGTLPNWLVRWSWCNTASHSHIFAWNYRTKLFFWTFGVDC